VGGVAMTAEFSLPPQADFAALGFDVLPFGDGGLALRREPFRVSWIFTQLVTFVFLIPRQVESWDEMMADYDELRAFGSRHKKTWLGRGFQCGYALLPIYVGSDFALELHQVVQTKAKKRWSMFHVPSLLDLGSATCGTLASDQFWGVIYRSYIKESIVSVADVVLRSHAQH
jgi:hypothetical protein